MKLTIAAGNQQYNIEITKKDEQIQCYATGVTKFIEVKYIGNITFVRDKITLFLSDVNLNFLQMVISHNECEVRLKNNVFYIKTDQIVTFISYLYN